MSAGLSPGRARLAGTTIVTHDLEASLALYRDALGYQILGDGGERDGGRHHVLLGYPAMAGSPTLRLVEAAPGAAANRPRPQVGIADPGLAAIECATADWQAAFRRLASAPVQLIAPPLCTFVGEAAAPSRSSMIFSVIGPAEEQLVIRCRIGEAAPFSGLFGPFERSILVCRDRWPLLDFYSALFGFGSTGEVAVGEDIVNYRGVNCALGAPPGSYFEYGALGEECALEWREYRQWKPLPQPPFPASLDRTGLAMTSIAVDEPTAVRANAVAGGYALDGDGGSAPFRIRGSLGELIEIVGPAERP